MSRFSGGMRTSSISAWLGVFAFLCAMLMRIAQAAPQTPASPAAADPLPATIEFNRDIRPILADKCFQCHGPAAQMATLRLDLEDGAKHALGGGRVAVVPGDPARSQLINRVTAANPAVSSTMKWGRSTASGGSSRGTPRTNSADKRVRAPLARRPPPAR